MWKCNCLRAAAICCEYFQHRREESFIRNVAHHCSVILTGDSRIHYPPMGTAVLFTEKLVAEWHQRHIYHLSSSRPSTPLFSKLIWENHFAISRPRYRASWQTSNPGSIIYSSGAKARWRSPSRSQTPCLLWAPELPAVEVIHGT